MDSAFGKWENLNVFRVLAGIFVAILGRVTSVDSDHLERAHGSGKRFW